MNKLFAITLIAITGSIVSIYSLSFTDINKNSVSMNNYKDKRILIVNTASTGSGVAQIQKLEQLYQLNKDSTIIIAFPSNSFGNEPKSDAEIKAFMFDSLHVNFPVALKSYITGDTANQIFKWLANKTSNDIMNAKVKRDFQKFLIDRSGLLVARFDSTIDPLDPAIQEAINDN